MEATYKQAAEFRSSIESAFTSGPVNAHWIADTSCFWYRKDLTQDSFTFCIVNAETAISRPAFDHEALQNALFKQNDQASTATFPFREMEIDSDLNIIKFQIDDKLWQYDCEGKKLSTCSMGGQSAESAAVLEPLKKEIASGVDNPQLQCCVTFVNKRSKRVRIWWINHQGEPQMPSVVEAGKSCRRRTWSAHVWRICDDWTDNVIASYVVPRRETALVMIDDDTRVPSDEDSALNGDSFPRCIVKQFNVHLSREGLPDAQLSFSGSEGFAFDPDHIYHSHDKKYACIWQYIPKEKRILYRIESTPRDQLQPRVLEKRYLKPGDRRRINRPRLFDLTRGEEILTSDTLYSNPYSLEVIGWSSDSQKYRFIYNERGHKVLRVIELDIKGNAQTLVEERQNTFVDYTKIDWHYEKDTDELIWLSERHGTNHLYVIKLDEKRGSKDQLEARQLTQGAFNVYQIERVDNNVRQVYVTVLGAVAGQDPYYMHLARVGIDDSSFTILTSGDGNHSWTWSPDFSYFLDEWSRVDQAPQIVLRDSTGKPILELQNSDLGSLTSIGWKAPERFTAPGRDGTTPIYGIMIRPSNFSPDKQYPVIEKIYAGPQGFSVPKSFSKLAKLYALAELGFIVVQIDGMGTNWRCRKFHETCYKNLKDAGLPDRIAWIKAAARTRPWMDITRVGIFGGSAGGQNALSALLWHGDFYKAAIADCGCHDNRLDKLWWNELWMGWPVDKAYEKNSNVVNAHLLTGNLMLIVGEMDDNVDPASTLQVVHALNRAGKDYEFLFIPGGGHGSGESTMYFLRRQWDFFVRHLIGAETPRWNDAEVRERLSVCYDRKT